MPTTKPKLPTPMYTEGAEAERRAVRAKLKRSIRDYQEGAEDCADKNVGEINAISCLLRWLNTRDERTAKRKGGVGRK